MCRPSRPRPLNRPCPSAGRSSVGPPERLGDVRLPRLAHGVGVGRHPVGREGALDVVRLEQLLGERPQPIEGALHARVTLARTVAEAHEKIGAALEVVGHLLGGLLGDLGKTGIIRARQRVEGG